MRVEEYQLYWSICLAGLVLSRLLGSLFGHVTLSIVVHALLLQIMLFVCPRDLGPRFLTLAHRLLLLFTCPWFVRLFLLADDLLALARVLKLTFEWEMPSGVVKILLFVSLPIHYTRLLSRHAWTIASPLLHPFIPIYIKASWYELKKKIWGLRHRHNLIVPVKRPT